MSRNRLPLAWRSLQAQIPISCYALAVLDKRYATLVSFRVEILKDYNTYPLVLEILPRIEYKPRRLAISRPLG